MTSPANTEVDQRILSILTQANRAAPHLELDEIRFIRCISSFEHPADGAAVDAPSIVFTMIETDATEAFVVSNLEFRLDAPAPFEGDDRKVTLIVRLVVRYVRKDDDNILDADAHAFARVNGIYNAWPYIREFVSNSLSRFALPPYELPLLTPDMAVRFAAPPDELDPSEKSADD